MDDQVISSQKNRGGEEDTSHRLSKEREVSREGTKNSSGSNFKRLVKRENPQHVIVSHDNNSQISKCCSESPLFQSTSLDSRIPKHILSLDEKFRRRCLKLIHISAFKAAQCHVAVNLSSVKMGVSTDSLSVGKIRSGYTCDTARFVFDYSLAAGGESVVISPARQWIVGTVMGSKSMINILKSPLIHQVGPEGAGADFRRITSNDDKGSICYDVPEAPDTLTFSSPKTEKETPIEGSTKHGHDEGHKRLVSMCSTDSPSSDQSSRSSLAAVCQGMLQCTWKGGNPHFVFSKDEQKEVYVANLWKVQSKEYKALDYVYLFHAGKGGQKNHEIRDSESHLVGKMKVSNLVSLCSNSSKIMETEFVLYGGGTEMDTSSHNLKKSKGLSKKMAEVFRTGQSCKQKKISKLSGALENSSRESCLDDTGNSQDDLGVPNLLDDHLPSNFELATIVVKDHVADDRKEEAGGWGLKFLKTVGVKKTSSSAEVSVPLECCQDNGECSTSMDVLIPAGFHGGPRTRIGGPSSLTERWRSGYCDCGGWDMGCPLTVLKSNSRKEDILPQSDTQGDCKPFDLNIQGSEHAAPTLRMLNVHDGLYFVHYQPTLSTLQSFSIAVAIIHTQTPSLRPKCTEVSTKIQG